MQKPLWERLYSDAAYIEIARVIGYQGTTYREMLKKIEPLEKALGKERVHSATYYLVEFEGQMTCNPKPLAEVKLRPDVRRLCWQLLGPPPEKRAEFFSHSRKDSESPIGTKQRKRTRKRRTG